MNAFTQGSRTRSLSFSVMASTDRPQESFLVAALHSSPFHTLS